MSPVDGENDIVEIIHNRPLSKTEKIALLEIQFGKGEIALPYFEEQQAFINEDNS